MAADATLRTPPISEIRPLREGLNAAQELAAFHHSILEHFCSRCPVLGIGAQAIGRGSFAVTPESRTPFSVCYSEDRDVRVDHSKYDVEREPPKDSSPEIGLELRKPSWRIANQIDQASSSSRNRLAARILRAAYQAVAASASSSADGWKRTWLGINP